MTGIRTVAATLAAVLIAVGGFVVGRASREPASPPKITAAGAAQPMAANPTTPPEPATLPDSDYPALAEDLDWTPVVMGLGAFRYRWVVPKGWQGGQIDVNEWKWVPEGNPTDSHSVRVEIVTSQHQSLKSILLNRIELLREAEGVHDFTILQADLATATLQYRYVNLNQRVRINTLRWLSLDGSDQAQVEIATEGRTGDLPGLTAMNQRIWDSLSRVS